MIFSAITVAIFVFLMIDAIVQVCIVVKFVLTIDLFDFCGKFDLVTRSKYFPDFVIFKLNLTLGRIEGSEDNGTS